MNIYESGEDYLEQILMLLEQKGHARSIDIALGLNVSKPSVSVAMKKLKENGYIKMSTDNLISLTDKGYGLFIAAFLCHLDVSLDSYVSRARCLAWRCAAVIAVDLVCISVEVIPFIRAPYVVVWKLVHWVHDFGTVFAAELLAEPGCARRANFNALAARYALVCVDVSAVSGA